MLQWLIKWAKELVGAKIAASKAENTRKDTLRNLLQTATNKEYENQTGMKIDKWDIELPSFQSPTPTTRWNNIYKQNKKKYTN